jgi:hypothetical protein
MHFDRDGRSVRCSRRAHSLLLVAALSLLAGTASSESPPALCGGATDSGGTAVLVHDPAALDVILKGRWAEMKAALASGNITAALDVIALKDRDAYGAMFQAMSASHLASIDEILTDLSSIRKLQTGRVEYEMFRRHSDGKLISHPVTFRFDADGVWRVEFL